MSEKAIFERFSDPGGAAKNLGFFCLGSEKGSWKGDALLLRRKKKKKKSNEKGVCGTVWGPLSDVVISLSDIYTSQIQTITRLLKPNKPFPPYPTAKSQKFP